MKLRIDPLKRLQRSQSVLRSDSKTLRYEIEMLIGLAQGLCSGQTRFDRITDNAKIESFAIHCRALIFFLYGHLDGVAWNDTVERFAGLRDTDVLAFDYHPQWDQDCPPPTGAIVDAKWRADKHVAHITTDRREVNQSGSGIESIWNIGDATAAICSSTDCLLQKSPASNFDPAELALMRTLLLSQTPRAEPTSPQTALQQPLFRADRFAPTARNAVGTREIATQTRHNMHAKTG